MFFFTCAQCRNESPHDKDNSLWIRLKMIYISISYGYSPTITQRGACGRFRPFVEAFARQHRHLMSAIIRKRRYHSESAIVPRSHRNQNFFARGLRLAGMILLLSPCVLAAQQAVDEDAPWPRVRSTNGSTVTLYLPEVESWTSNSFSARAVVEVKPAKTKRPFWAWSGSMPKVPSTVPTA